MTIDLDTLNLAKACDKSFPLELLHPVSEKPLGVFINILGKESSIVKKHTRDTRNEELRAEAMLEESGKKPEVETIEKIQAKAVKFYVACTVGWDNVVYKGKELPFSVENATMLYSDEGMEWIRKQIDIAVGKLENFIKG